MGLSIGIDLGGTNLAVGLVDQRDRILDRESVPTGSPGSADRLADRMATSVRTLLLRQNREEASLESIGIGLPGPVDPRTGRLIEAANLSLRDVDFVSLMHAHFPQTPIFTGNDGDCAAWGAYLAGEGRLYESSLTLTLGTGVGGGLVIGRRLFRGGTGLGIEPGHTVVAAGEGPPCTCGRRGCLENYVSIRGLNRLLMEELESGAPSALREMINPQRPSFNVIKVFDQVRQGDPLAARVIRRYAGYLAAGIRTLTVLLRPHVILLGGGISRAGNLLLEPLNHALTPPVGDDSVLSLPPILISRLGNDAGIIGAARLSLEGLV